MVVLIPAQSLYLAVVIREGLRNSNSNGKVWLSYPRPFAVLRLNPQFGRTKRIVVLSYPHGPPAIVCRGLGNGMRATYRNNVLYTAPEFSKTGLEIESVRWTFRGLWELTQCRAEF